MFAVTHSSESTMDLSRDPKLWDIDEVVAWVEKNGFDAQKEKFRGETL